MARYLKAVAILVVLFGLACGVRFAHLAKGDADYARKKLARERNVGNMLFEAEYRVAEARHLFLVYSSAGGFLIAVVGGSLLWGLGSLHGKLDG